MIRYMPKMDSALWTRKCQETFANIEDMKGFIADQRTRFCQFIGKPDCSYNDQDVELKFLCKRNPALCLKNCFTVVVGGTVVGYCGE